MGGFAAILPVFQAIAPVLGSLLGGGSSAPSPAPAPAAPAAAPAPEAPEVSTAADVDQEQPVIDSEAAKIRANKRRESAEQRKLFTLSDEEDDGSVVLTKSLLGD